MTSSIPITHNAAASRFECTVDGHLSVADYQLHDSVMLMTHTGVPAALQGRGIAAALVAEAIAHARAQGLKVKPLCSYVDVWMRRHPESLDLLA